MFRTKLVKKIKPHKPQTTITFISKNLAFMGSRGKLL